MIPQEQDSIGQSDIGASDAAESPHDPSAEERAAQARKKRHAQNAKPPNNESGPHVPSARQIEQTKKGFL